MSQSSEDGKPSKSSWARIGELGPAWITAIAGLVTALAGTGLFVFLHSTGANNPDSGPSTTTVTSPVPSSFAPSVSSASSFSASSDGAQLGSYNVALPLNHSVFLDPTPPTQSQIAAGSGSGDISESRRLIPAVGDKMFSLPLNTIPTYQGCAADNQDANEASTIPELHSVWSSRAE
jgi:hypothetical protein